MHFLKFSSNPVFKSFGLLLLVFSLSSLLVKASDCQFYMPLTEGSGLKMEHYNARDRLQHTQEIRVVNVRQSPEGTEATLEARVFDTRNRLQHEARFEVVCSGNELRLDLQSLIDPATMAGFQGMEIEMEGENLVVPSGLSVGQELPGAVLNIRMSSQGANLGEMQMIVSDRKVISRENIEVPAGRFDAYKISYQNRMDVSAMGMAISSSTSRTVEYHSPGIGVIRTEIYDSRDRLQSYTVLSNIL